MSVLCVSTSPILPGRRGRTGSAPDGSYYAVIGPSDHPVLKARHVPVPTTQFIADARRHLSEIDPALRVADSVTPVFEWRVKAPGFATMVHLILEQQVSVASALAVFKRLEAGVGTMTPEHLATHTVDELKVFGLSGQKARYILAIAEAQLTGLVNFDTLNRLSDDEASATLVKIKGIGRWTAEAYLMGSEGRTDIFPAGDLALQEGLRFAEGSNIRLSEKQLYQRAEAWRPYRGIAAHLLWSFYTGVKKGELIPPAIKLAPRE